MSDLTILDPLAVGAPREIARRRVHALATHTVEIKSAFHRLDDVGGAGIAILDVKVGTAHIRIALVAASRVAGRLQLQPPASEGQSFVGAFAARPEARADRGAPNRAATVRERWDCGDRSLTVAAQLERESLASEGSGGERVNRAGVPSER